MKKITIVGGGNLGSSLGTGLIESGKVEKDDLIICKRNISTLSHLSAEGYQISNDIEKAVSNAEIIVIAVLPQQFDGVMEQLQSVLNPEKQLLVSVASGIIIAQIEQQSKGVPVVRAMPNTAISIRESMTCISVNHNSKEYEQLVVELFNSVGTSLVINEELMTSATALCACGIAFFLRAIRAASQGGVQVGFHADEALKMAAQTAKGAAALLVEHESHPENEIDKVTSPEGCTIAGLNQMEHQGFSSALIRGIITSAEKAGNLY